MREAVIVSYARTGLAKSGRGGFNITPTVTMAAHAVKHAVDRAKRREGGGRGLLHGQCRARRRQYRPQRRAARRPADHHRRRDHQPLLLVGPAVDRHGGALRSSTTAPTCVVAGGVESISFPGGGGARENNDPELVEDYPGIYMAMIDTADIVAERYKVSREYQDEYSLESQRRMAAAQQAGKFKDEIVPMKTKMKMVDRETKEERIVDYVVDRDECNRPDTTLEGLAKLEPVKGPGKFITAGNASPALGRRRGGGADGSQGSRAPRPQAAGPFHGLGRRRLRARRDGHRSGVRRAAPARAPRPEGRRHRPVGAERGVRLPVPLLPRHAGHRSGEVQRQRRLDRHRPSRSA